MAFQTDTAHDERSPIFATLKAVLPAAALALSVLTAAPASAATVVMDNGSMESPRVVNIAGIGNVYAAPMLFDGTYGGKPFVDLVAFCVDVYHHITLGNYSPDLVYTDTVPLTTDSKPTGATLLTSAQLTQVGRLVNYGTDVFYNAPAGAARHDRLAAVQSAIWEVVSGKNVTSSNAGLDAAITQLSGASYLDYIGGFGGQSSAITFLSPLTYPRIGPQAFAIAHVPEPAAWGLMILGFGAIGAMLRRKPGVALA